MNDWHPGQVVLDELGPLDAQIHAVRWNGFACPRFARPEAEQIVDFNHRHHTAYAAQGSPDAYEDMRWDSPDSPDTIIVADHEGGTSRIEPDEDGMWSIGAWSWTWQAVRQDWPDRDKALAILTGDDFYRTMARRLRLERESVHATDPHEDRDAWSAAVTAEQQTDRSLWSALLSFGVPVGCADEAAAAVYEAAGITLPQTNIVAPRPCPQVTGIEYLETSRGVSFVAALVRDGEPYGAIENRGDGGATTFTPTGTEHYGTRLREMEAFAAACAHPEKDLCEEDVYNGLVDEYERGEQAARFPATGDSTLIRCVSEIDYEYLSVRRPPRAMARTLHTRLGPNVKMLIEAGARCEYWDGRHRWHRLTIVERT